MPDIPSPLQTPLAPKRGTASGNKDMGDEACTYRLKLRGPGHPKDTYASPCIGKPAENRLGFCCRCGRPLPVTPCSGCSFDDLEEAICSHLIFHGTRPMPCVWTKSANVILGRERLALEAIDQIRGTGSRRLGTPATPVEIRYTLWSGLPSPIW